MSETDANFRSYHRFIFCLASSHKFGSGVGFFFFLFSGVEVVGKAAEVGCGMGTRVGLTSGARPENTNE